MHDPERIYKAPLLKREGNQKKPRLLLVGTDSTHTVNYYHLIKEHFSAIEIITSKGAGRWGKIPVLISDLSFRHPLRIIHTLCKFWVTIRQFKPDIIHVHQAGTPALYTLLTRPKGIPVVLTAWGSDVLQVPSISRWHKALVRFALRKGDQFTADSRYVAGEMKRLAYPHPIEVVVANFGIPQLPPTGPKENLIYSNRLHKKLYRIDEVLKAFARFIQHHPSEDWKLVIAGHGDETEKLRLLASDLGISLQTEFIGFVDQAINLQFYSRASVFISIPVSDATSISLLEAIAAGCRPVVSKLPSNEEWIEHGLNGIVVEDLTTDFISEVLALDYDRLLAVNSDLAQKKATKEVNREIFLGVYDALLNPS